MFCRSAFSANSVQSSALPRQRGGSAALACIPSSDPTEARLFCLVIVLGLDLLLLLHRWLLALR
jgi:hypothetical protein